MIYNAASANEMDLVLNGQLSFNFSLNLLNLSKLSRRGDYEFGSVLPLVGGGYIEQSLPNKQITNLSCFMFCFSLVNQNKRDTVVL